MDLQKTIQNLKDQDRKTRKQLLGASTPEDRDVIFKASVSNDKWIEALRKAENQDVAKG